MIFFNFNNKKYCFIHIPKTAGTSFQSTIKNENKENKKINSIFENYMKKNFCTTDHVPFFFINNVFLKKIDIDKNIEFLSIVRNPWERFASLFEQIMLRNMLGFQKKTMLHKDNRSLFIKDFVKTTENLLTKSGFFDSKHKKDFFKFWLFYLGYERKLVPTLNANFNILPQSWWITDSLGEKIVDDIYLFEDLNLLEDNFQIKLSHELKKPKKNNYFDYYDQQTIDYVYNLEKYTIDKFGYDFKNI